MKDEPYYLVQQSDFGSARFIYKIGGNVNNVWCSEAVILVEHYNNILPSDFVIGNVEKKTKRGITFKSFFLSFMPVSYFISFGLFKRYSKSEFKKEIDDKEYPF